MPMKISYRILYVFLAILLLAFVVLQPLSASAVVAEGAALGAAAVALKDVIAAILIALGIGVGLNSDFHELVSDICSNVSATFSKWIDGTGALKVVYEEKPNLELLPPSDPKPPVMFYIPFELIDYVLQLLQDDSGDGAYLEIWEVSFPGNSYWSNLVSDLQQSDPTTYDLLRTFRYGVFYKTSDGAYFVFSNEMIDISPSELGHDISCNSLCLVIQMSLEGAFVSASVLSSWLRTLLISDLDVSTPDVITDLDLDIDLDCIGSTLESGAYDDLLDTVQPFEWSDEEAALYVPFVFPDGEGEWDDLSPPDIRDPGPSPWDQILRVLDISVDVPDPAGSSGSTDSPTVNYTGFFDTIIGELVNIGLVIGDFFSSFWNTLRNILEDIFVPSEDFLSAKIDSLRSEFGFVNDIIIAVDEIRSVFNESADTPPVIYADLSAAESIYDWGDRAVVLDLTWYSRYKPTADTLISAFLWVVFTWRCFVKLPGIISGDAGDLFMDSMYDTGKVEPRSVRRARLYRGKNKKKESGSDS